LTGAGRTLTYLPAGGRHIHQGSAKEQDPMDGNTSYLNTDLDVISRDDLTALARVFDSRGLFPLYVTHGDDERWYATFEVLGQHTEPEPNIAEMIAVVESLRAPHRSVWRDCMLREFNIGYDCGAEPWAFNQGLSCELLRRIAAVGASLRWTLYPDREAVPAKPARKRKR
jgi:hypothetical protein